MIDAIVAFFRGTPECDDRSHLWDDFERAKQEQRQAAQDLSAELAAASFEELFKQ